LGEAHARGGSQAGLPYSPFTGEEEYPHNSILDRARVAAVYTESMMRNKSGILVATCALGLSLVLAQPPKQQPAGDPAKGKTTFGAQCTVCHNADSTVKKLGPGLKGLFKRAKLVNGKAVTEANVRAIIDAGGNGMLPFKELLNAAQKDDLIAYLKSL
jgi:cytochrome c